LQQPARELSSIHARILIGPDEARELREIAFVDRDAVEDFGSKYAFQSLAIQLPLELAEQVVEVSTRSGCVCQRRKLFVD
jgi:hypothetical protein